MDSIKDLKFPRFFSDFSEKADLKIGEKTVIKGGDAKHIALVLRMKAGERLILCGGDGCDYPCEIISVSNNIIEVVILEKFENKREPSLYIRLFQCVPKGEKLDLIVQKTTELGVSEIIPVISRRCVSRPDKKSAKSEKLTRLRKISEAAAKQSGRGKIPLIHEFTSFSDALKLYKKENAGIIFYENGGMRINEIFRAETGAGSVLDVFIGSEGGFEPREIEAAEEAGLKPASLGRLILRTETAPIAAVAILMNLAGEI